MKRHCEKKQVRRYLPRERNFVKEVIQTGEPCEAAYLDKQAIDANKRRQSGKALPGRVQQTMEIKVLVTMNLVTDSNLRDGAKDVIVKRACAVRRALHQDDAHRGRCSAKHKEHDSYSVQRQCCKTGTYVDHQRDCQPPYGALAGFGAAYGFCEISNSKARYSCKTSIMQVQ